MPSFQDRSKYGRGDVSGTLLRKGEVVNADNSRRLRREF